MSCCAPTRPQGIPSCQAPALPTTGKRAQTVAFAGGRSFVGTDTPMLPQDGEGPKRFVNLAPFSIEREPVTNRRFADFIRATGYVTEAERFGWAPVFAGLLSGGAAHAPIDATPWWTRVDGASWSAPEGPGSTIEDRLDHPVVQVSWGDANAFASWTGGRLPREAEWEFAARGGVADPKFPWGDDEPSDTRIRANIWQGNFPHHNTLADGYLGTSPVGRFAPNGIGLVDMIGNTWEWAADAFRIHSVSKSAKTRNAQALRLGEKLLKGGSFLCHISYCYRYRIAARMAMTPDSCASNVGFRVAYDHAAGENSHP